MKISLKKNAIGLLVIMSVIYTTGGLSSPMENGLSIASTAYGYGGGSSRSRDYCPDGDFTSSKYDRDCGVNPDDEVEETGTGNLNKNENGLENQNENANKYVSKEEKINKIGERIDNLIGNKGKELSGEALRLRNEFIIKVEEYLNIFKDGDKEQLKILKEEYIELYKQLHSELNKKDIEVKEIKESKVNKNEYKSKNSKISKFGDLLDKKIAKKYIEEDSSVWENRNKLVELLDEYISKKDTLEESELLKMKEEIIEAYKKILSEIK